MEERKGGRKRRKEGGRSEGNKGRKEDKLIRDRTLKKDRSLIFTGKEAGTCKDLTDLKY